MRCACVRRRAYLHLLHGQCYFICPRGFKHDVQLMQCLPQDERWEIWCQIQAKPMHHFSIQVWFVFLYLIPVSYLSRPLSLHSALWGWGMDTLGSMCSDTEHSAPQEGRGVTYPASFAVPKSAVTPVHMCYRSGSVSPRRDQRVQKVCIDLIESPI